MNIFFVFICSWEQVFGSCPYQLKSEKPVQLQRSHHAVVDVNVKYNVANKAAICNSTDGEPVLFFQYLFQQLYNDNLYQGNSEETY